MRLAGHRLYRELDNPHGEATTLNHLGKAYRRRADYAAARDSHQQALDLVRPLGFQREQAIALNGLGEAALHGGDPKQAV